MKILIVEDHEAWSSKLRDMYEQVLGSDCVVRVANSYEQAESELKNRTREWDLLSLDINLGDGNGLDLLEIAYGKDWVKGAVVISGISLDKDPPVSIEPAKLKRMRSILPQEVEKAFPGAFLLSKNPLSYSSEIDSVNNPEIVGKIIEDFKNDLTAELLNELASPSYVLDVSEAEYDPIEPKICLRSPRQKPKLLTEKYARLLYLLARKSKTNENYGRVSAEELQSIFFNVATAQTAFDAVKRHLRKKEIKVEFIIEGTIANGLSLLDRVKVEGVDRTFNPNYTLVINQGYGPDDIKALIRFHRNKEVLTRSFLDREALFLWDLAEKNRSHETLCPDTVLERLDPDSNTIDKEAKLGKAREKITEFEDRLRNDDKPLDPYRVIVSNEANTSWWLSKGVVVEGLGDVFHKKLGKGENMLTHTQSRRELPEQVVDDSEEQKSVERFSAKNLDFIVKSKCFSEFEIRLARAIHDQVSAEDFAEELGRDADEIEDEMQALEKKWHDLGGPALR